MLLSNLELNVGLYFKFCCIHVATGANKYLSISLSHTFSLSFSSIYW